MKISIIIPAYNEEANIGKTILGIQDCFLKEIDEDITQEIIVVDDGSKDKTYDEARKLDIQVLKLDTNQGKGGALRAGLKLASGDIIAFIDADLAESSYEVHRILIPIIQEKADVTIARFKPPKKKGGFGFVKGLASFGVRLYTGKNIKSVLSGQRAFRREVLEDIGTIPEGFGIEVGMLIDILKKGYTVLEVKTDMTHDVTGRDIKGFLHRGRQFIDIFKVLIGKLGGGWR